MTSDKADKRVCIMTLCTAIAAAAANRATKKHEN